MRMPTAAGRVFNRAMHTATLENFAGVEATFIPSMATRPIPKRHVLPSAWYRAGTSKGLFIQRQHLPTDQSAWESIILSAMGSREGDSKQLNGLGGGSPTTSKVAVIAKSMRQDVDLEYTFVQVVPDSGRLDMTGNCGNIASGVGPYALNEGLISVPSGQTQAIVKILNTNTQKIMEAVVQVDEEGQAYEEGHYLLPGLGAGGSPIELSFVDPAGSMTGKTLPTGNPQDLLEVQSGSERFTVRATMIDVANPFVLVDQDSLPKPYSHLGPHAPASLKLIEDIRRTASVHMGLARDTKTAGLTRGTPKIAVVSTATDATADLFVTSFSTGRVHPSLQLTGAVCISAAVVTPGTVAWELASKVTSRESSPTPSVASEGSSPSSTSAKHTEEVVPSQSQHVTIAHGSGKIDAVVSSTPDVGAGGLLVNAVTVIRTARRLFEGNVYYNI